jgi:hypothetical protein
MRLQRIALPNHYITGRIIPCFIDAGQPEPPRFVGVYRAWFRQNVPSMARRDLRDSRSAYGAIQRGQPHGRGSSNAI